MQPKQSKPSPYYEPELSLALFKMRLQEHLATLQMPVLHNSIQHARERDCHIIERNQTIEAVRMFMESVEK